MSLAIEFLRDALQRHGLTQAEYASACQMHASMVTDILAGTVAISSRNIEKLLRGLADREDQLRFLAAYLRDEIPLAYANDVSVQLEATSARATAAARTNANDEEQLLKAFRELSSRKHQTLVLSIVRHLRNDAELRDLIAQMMEYVDGTPARAVSQANKSLSKPVKKLERPA